PSIALTQQGRNDLAAEPLGIRRSPHHRDGGRLEQAGNLRRVHPALIKGAGPCINIVHGRAQSLLPTDCSSAPTEDRKSSRMFSTVHPPNTKASTVSLGCDHKESL